MFKPTETLAGLRVLVVEDEALIADEISDRLAKLGFTPVGIRDTAALAVEAARTLAPDLVLMDIRLKGTGDGIEAADTIAQDCHIPVVFLTAHSDHATLQRAKGAAPFGYILKPFQERDLLIAIEMAHHRHALEQKLRSSELKYAATLASIADGVIATDAEGNVSYMNPVAEALVGVRFAEAEWSPVELVMPLVDEVTRAAAEHPLRQALALKSVVSAAGAVLVLDRSGAAVPVDCKASVIRDARGRIDGAVIAFRDIRERRLAEDALQQAEEQLRQAQKMEAVGQLAGGVAHDFNNLLTVIGGYSELLLENSKIDEASRGLLREINRAGGRASELTRQLLAFSRKQMQHRTVLDLNALIMEISRMLARLIGEDIRMTLQLAQGPARVSADAGQMEQIILNLAVNARDAMPTGGEIRIRTERIAVDAAITDTRPEMPAGRYIALSVTDTGVGMAPTVQSRLFEPFFTTKEVGKGTGLGLATVYGIVKQTDGYIFVYSELGHGTTFKIYLPEAGVAADHPATPPATNRHAGSETVLLVEDDANVRNVASMALRDRGYTVLAPGSSREAAETYAGQLHRIDILVTDVVMPDVSGSQLARILRESKPRLRVLYMSGYTDDSVLRHGVLTGVDAFLQKPFTSTSLAAKIREVLDSADSRNADA